jgi:hypothetical protein
MIINPMTLFGRAKSALFLGQGAGSPEDGMITVWEHFLLFLLLSLLVSLVYSGLRQEQIKTIVRLAFKRFVVFMGASAVFGVVVYYLARSL